MAESSPVRRQSVLVDCVQVRGLAAGSIRGNMVQWSRKDVSAEVFPIAPRIEQVEMPNLVYHRRGHDPDGPGSVRAVETFLPVQGEKQKEPAVFLDGERGECFGPALFARQSLGEGARPGATVKGKPA